MFSSEGNMAGQWREGAHLLAMTTLSSTHAKRKEDIQYGC